jgi:cytoskeletal protein RodZ
MSITLGEKLRQAREARGISISEIAEQTRISPLYIKSIEEDDYRTLPGGIFNKGFLKSYAKYVGIDEQEALQDYAALIGSQNNQIESESRSYRPEVLTDNRSSSSLRTIILAALILGLGAFGVLSLVRYFQNNQSNAVVNNTNALVNSNGNLSSSANVANTSGSTVSALSMNEIKAEFKALNEPVYVSSNSDGTKTSTLMTPDKPMSFEPKEILKLGYAKSLASNVQLTINGKQIALPTTPLNPRRNVIEFEITKDNLSQIWQSGKISFDEAANPNAPR